MNFFISVSFFRHRFFRLFYGATQTDLDGLGSCASHSDSLISLSYSMAVFSTKSFGLFKLGNYMAVVVMGSILNYIFNISKYSIFMIFWCVTSSILAEYSRPYNNNQLLNT